MQRDEGPYYHDQPEYSNSSLLAMAGVAIQDVAFAGRCERVVIDFINRSENVVGCVAWLTNPMVIAALERIPRAEIVVTADTVHNRPALGLHRIGVRQIGAARGRYRSLMHHKFMVRLTNGQPTHVLLGSYNFTRRSNHNIGESIIVVKCSRTAGLFADEARRALRASRPIRYNARGARPDVRRR